MICGAAGIGKSSFVDQFLKKFNKKRAEELLNKKGKVSTIIII